MSAIRIGIIGFGKIAIDQHVPAIVAQPRLQLIAGVAQRHAPPTDIALFPDHRAMLAAGGLDAMAICTPPEPRYAIARDCLEAGIHCLLEKPPTTTMGELDELAAIAARRGLTLFTSWHARFNEAVDRATAIVHREGLAGMTIEWLEDVEKWHPGQKWIWAPGGFGVFDAGINALSIATNLSPVRLIMQSAQFVQEQGKQAPIAAKLALAGAGIDAAIQADLDWRHKSEERWTVRVETNEGTKILLSQGGATLKVGGELVCRDSGGEYPAIYRRFVELIDSGQSLIDGEPQRLMADAFLIAERRLEPLDAR